jgi:GNAT superfamily N-acetyltransferase
VIVRDATPEDYPNLQRMGSAFAKAANQPPVNPDTLRLTLDHLRANGVLKVAENGAVCGVIGALVFSHYWNAHELIAQELFWFVEESARGTSAGIKLLAAAEKACRERGARQLLMLALDDLEGDRVAEVYRRRGYEPQEKTFRKDLWL